MGQIDDLCKILHEQDKAEFSPLDFQRRLCRISKEDSDGDLSRNECNRRMRALMNDVKSGIESFAAEHHVRWLAGYKEKKYIFRLGQYVDSKDIPTDRHVLHDRSAWKESFISGGYFSGDIRCHEDNLEIFELTSHPKKGEYLDSVVSAINDGMLKCVEVVRTPNRLFSLRVIDSHSDRRCYCMNQRIESYCPYNYTENLVKEMMKRLLREDKTEVRE